MDRHRAGQVHLRPDVSCRDALPIDAADIDRGGRGSAGIHDARGHRPDAGSIEAADGDRGRAVVGDGSRRLHFQARGLGAAGAEVRCAVQRDGSAGVGDNGVGPRIARGADGHIAVDDQCPANGAQARRVGAAATHGDLGRAIERDRAAGVLDQDAVVARTVGQRDRQRPVGRDGRAAISDETLIAAAGGPAADGGASPQVDLRAGAGRVGAGTAVARQGHGGGGRGIDHSAANRGQGAHAGSGAGARVATAGGASRAVARLQPGAGRAGACREGLVGGECRSDQRCDKHAGRGAGIGAGQREGRARALHDQILGSADGAAG